MEYDKRKISRLVYFKEQMEDGQEKEDLEWVISQYNKYYLDSKDYDFRGKDYTELLKKYYNSEEDKKRFQDELQILRTRYKILKQTHRELKKEYNMCCKKLKNMI